MTAPTLADTLTCPRCAGQQLTCDGGAYCYKCSLFVPTPGRELRPSYRGKETRVGLDAPETAAAGVCGGSSGQGRRQKYGAQKTVVDGITFDSKRESERYRDLCSMEAAGEISDLQTKTPGCVFDLTVNGVKVSRFTADFRYTERGQDVVEDLKSGPTRTRAYVMRKKLMLAVHGIEIRETS